MNEWMHTSFLLVDNAHRTRKKATTEAKAAALVTINAEAAAKLKKSRMPDARPAKVRPVATSNKFDCS